MARMMGHTWKSTPCNCWDCGGPEIKGRATEKREWKKEIENVEEIENGEVRVEERD